MLNAWTSILQLTESIPLASLPGVARKYAREIGMIAGAFALVFVLIPQPGVSEALAFGAVDA